MLATTTSRKGISLPTQASKSRTSFLWASWLHWTKNNSNKWCHKVVVICQCRCKSHKSNCPAIVCYMSTQSKVYQYLSTLSKSSIFRQRHPRRPLFQSGKLRIPEIVSFLRWLWRMLTIIRAVQDFTLRIQTHRLEEQMKVNLPHQVINHHRPKCAFHQAMVSRARWFKWVATYLKSPMWRLQTRTLSGLDNSIKGRLRMATMARFRIR